jgi:acyl-CoA thioesterase-2
VSDALDHLLGLLDLEKIDRNLYRGDNPDSGGRQRRVFGGQVASQALMAATKTVEVDHRVNSLHAYFLRPGRPGLPITYSIDRIRDGASFTTRRVVASQDGEAIFNLDASFHREEPGLEFELAAPLGEHVPGPEDVPRSQHGNAFSHRRAIDAREFREPRPRPTSTRAMWMRTDGELPDDPSLHACVLVFMSDSGPVGAARRPLLPDAHEGPDRRMMAASLDHTMWFHRPVQADRWLLYDLEAVAASNARALARGTIYTREGHTVASVTQEVLLRPVG